jgi:hypothetical protein
MGFFSNLFSTKEPSAEEIVAKKMALFEIKLRDLTLRLTHKRLAMQEGANVVAFEELQGLSDYEVSSLPEDCIVIMAALYRRAIGEGAPHHVALSIVNSTRLLPIQWKAVSKFQTIEEYIVERLKVEQAAMDRKHPILKYLTQDFVSYGVQEANLVIQEIFGY